MKTEQNIEAQIQRVITREATPAEEERVREWVSERAENKRVFDEIWDIWYALQADKVSQQFNANEAWESYRNWMHSSREKTKPHGLQRRLLTIGKYAAVAILAAAISFFWLQTQSDTDDLAPFVVEVPRGETSVLTLYDGTEVHLNSGSRLMCSSYNSKHERRVQLEGEGFFKVAHDAKKPFFVEVKNVAIKVYGTKFNVYAYSEEDFLRTTLIEGKVGVLLPNGEEYLLKPNETVKVADNGSLSVVKSLPERFVSWREGVYTFKHEPLKNIAMHMERMFDMKVVFHEEILKQQKYSGTIKSKDHVLDVLQRMALTSPFQLHYELKDREIHLSMKK
jgi:ferric-dicitrate binding protein FerR (iron transport regulator)